MQFTNEFLKHLIGEIIDKLDEEMRDADDAMKLYPDTSKKLEDAKGYNYHLGKWNLAKYLQEDVLSKLGRETLKKDNDLF
ncbi:MAG: hypothetical protein ACWGQW_09045 [bacterium]